VAYIPRITGMIDDMVEIMDQRDQQLVRLLKENARASTTSLAQAMGLSRSTVQDRLQKLEKSGTITGYTVRIADNIERRMIKAHVMIAVDPKHRAEVNATLRQLSNISSLYAINGAFDLIAILTTETTQEVDKTLDMMGEMDGIVRTQSAIVLSTKFER
jgi:DNA-binding Lrp family transcriptional regulator